MQKMLFVFRMQRTSAVWELNNKLEICGKGFSIYYLLIGIVDTMCPFSKQIKIISYS